jgi:beta-glucanase (GH16 family)
VRACHTEWLAALSSSPLPSSTRTRRSRRLGAAVLAAAALATVTAALPSFAATAPRKSSSAAASLTTTVTKRLARAGTYTVVVTVAGPAAGESVTVSVGASVQRDVALTAGQSTALAFYAHFRGRSFKVRAVASSVAVHITVAAARQDTEGASGGSSGSIGAGGRSGVVYTAPAKGPYTHLVWSDEFAGAAGMPPDPSDWTPDVGGGCGDGSLSTATTNAANASLDGRGNLAISAYENAVSAGSPSFTSAEINTNDKVSFSYGELEARIDLPRGSGLCSGFWLVGDSAAGGCFPQCGEIDVMEAITSSPGSVFGTLHGPIAGTSNYQQFQSSVTAPTSLPGSFHTYGLIWQPGRITWTIDGVPYGTATPQQLPHTARWVFNGNPFHILLSLAVGGWPGPPAPGATFPATMRVDWVRLYD